MGLFDFFKKQEVDSPAKEHLTNAKSKLDNGEPLECLRTLAWGFKQDVNYKPLYQLAADCLGELHAEDERKLFTAVLNKPQDANAYNNLGNFYFGVGHYDLAQVFYEKTVVLQPSYSETLHDLAICYARRFQISKAIEVLNRSDLSDFWNLYFLNKCKILDSNTDGVQESIHMLLRVLDQHPNQEEVLVPRMKVEELQETLQRFQTVKDIQTHIRDWQFIQYGGVVLDFFEESEDYVAGGRFVASWGSHESIRLLANKLKQFTYRLSISFQAVLALPDRDSEITGRLIAQILGLDFGFYDNIQMNQDCLIVASESSHLQNYPELNTISKGQVVFAVNHNWLDHALVCPDIIGFMTQTYSFPWNGGGMRVTDFESGKIEPIPADERTTEEIAADIFNMEQETPAEDKHLEFYAYHKDYLKGIGHLSGDKRYSFMIESPVPGSYFA